MYEMFRCKNIGYNNKRQDQFELECRGILSMSPLKGALTSGNDKFVLVLQRK